MKQINKVQWIMILGCIVACLMGITYAGYTDRLSIIKRVSTAKMDYNFDIEGKILHVTLGNEMSNELLGMTEGQSYEISYKISKNDEKNIELKKLENYYIGSIQIALKDVTFNQNGVEVELDQTLLESVPSSLGVFDCYHDFDGVKGIITMVKKSPPMELQTVIMKSDLSDETQQLLGIAATDQEKQGKSNNLMVEDMPELTTIWIEGIYEFKIPLIYDQFNVLDEM